MDSRSAREATLAAIRTVLESIVGSGRARVSDELTGLEVLDDLAGTGDAQEVSFQQPVELLLLEADGGEARMRISVDPTETNGIRLRDGEKTYIPVQTTNCRIWAPVGVTVTVGGMYR